MAPMYEKLGFEIRSMDELSLFGRRLARAKRLDFKSPKGQDLMTPPLNLEPTYVWRWTQDQDPSTETDRMDADTVESTKAVENAATMSNSAKKAALKQSKPSVVTTFENSLGTVKFTGLDSAPSIEVHVENEALTNLGQLKLENKASVLYATLGRFEGRLGVTILTSQAVWFRFVSGQEWSRTVGTTFSDFGEKTAILSLSHRPNVILATHPEAGILRSLDSGRNWEFVAGMQGQYTNLDNTLLSKHPLICMRRVSKESKRMRSFARTMMGGLGGFSCARGTPSNFSQMRGVHRSC